MIHLLATSALLCAQPAPSVPLHITMVIPRQSEGLETPEAITQALSQPLDQWLRSEGLGSVAVLCDPFYAPTGKAKLLWTDVRLEWKGGRAQLSRLITTLRKLGAPRDASIYWHSGGGDLRHQVDVWAEDADPGSAMSTAKPASLG